MAAFVFALVVAATTQASSSVVGYFQFSQKFCEGNCSQGGPGFFDQATASAVNADGTGGAAPGDVYVGGSGRIQQFSASDQFVRLWGAGVVKSGPGNADEAQAVRVDATGGAFRLGFGAATTVDIPANATAAQVQSALNGLASIGAGGVSVAGGPGDAGGTTPYLISFDGGSLADVDQPSLKATDGSVPLSGGGEAASVYTTRQGGSGFEICQPTDGDECTDSTQGQRGLGGSLERPPDMALNQATGDLYVNDLNRVNQFSASGQFIRAWGNDVVASGPDDSAGPNEQKSATVTADGGTFTLGYRRSFSAPTQSTGPLPYNASPAAVETALNSLAEIGGNYSSVTVTGGPGDLTGSSPYEIIFHGLLGGDDLDEVLVSNPNGLTISSGTKAVDVGTVANGGGYEVCQSDDACKEGKRSNVVGAVGFGEFGGGLDTGIDVAPAGAPNAGNVLVADAASNRVEEFTAAGAFVRMLGWDVDATEPFTGFEVCTAESGHICQPGASGGGTGQFANSSGRTLKAVGEDSSGVIYTAEGTGGNSYTGLGTRVQTFTPAAGLDLTPSLFGSTEIQALTVNAAAGQFRLALGFEEDGTRGTGDFTKGSTTVTSVNTNTGEFTAGQLLRNNSGGNFEYTIVAVAPGTLTLSEPADFTGVGVPMGANRPYTTPDLPYNASASAVESALNSLPSVNKAGGSVSVSGGPGDATGSSPYLISFDGGPLARTDPAQIVAANSATPLSGGSGGGASTANVITMTPGGPGGVDSDSAPFDVAIGPGDRVLVARYFPRAFTTCADGSQSPPEIRIEELSSSGTVIGTSDSCAGLVGFVQASNRTPNLTVNTSTGHPYLLNDPLRTAETFRLSQGARLSIFGTQGAPPGVTLEPVSLITTTGATISGMINPNGPGTSYPDTTGTPSVTKTTYRIEYKKASGSSWTKYTPDIPLGSGTSPLPFSVGIDGLAPKTPYELKVVAVKPFTATVEEVKSFTTLPAGPEIKSFSSSEVTATSARLNAQINPQGTETTYHFEYGTTPAYGSSTPETSIGESLDAQVATDQVGGLSDAVYHFRVVATNAFGTATSTDQTFTFHPPICPNQTVRQQTGAAYLPDCRAYELTSPEDAGGTTLSTGGPQSPYASNPPRLAFVGQLAAIPGSGRNPINTAGDLYLATRGAEGWHTRYIGPSSEEVGCVGGRPLISGTGEPATIQNDVMADPGLSRVLDWNLGNPIECAFGLFEGIRFADINTSARGSNAPYVWNAHGDFLDRWPTSVADVPGSEENFSCPQDPETRPYPEGVFGNLPVSYFCSTYVDTSKDLNHFVFSTQSGLFGDGGLTAAPGSAYDNDTAHNTLSLISKRPGGDPIGQEPDGKAGPEELIRFPAVSADGSHILMGTTTKPACRQLDFPGGEVDGQQLCPLVTQPTHLYMRVGNAITYDVSAGKAVHYIDSTPDVSKVYFTSDEQLTGDDADESTDLYMWNENGGAAQLTRISADELGSAGNADNCVSTWTTDCDVETYEDNAISAAANNQGGLGTWTSENTNPGYTDNAIAAGSGDIYFYSPEQLVAGEGAPGKENLYVFREGSVRHVATLEDDPYCIDESSVFFEKAETCSNGAVGRLQVTSDGRYAAFITTSRITGYDSHGFAEMYRYDSDADTVQCVSCRIDGSAPQGDVLGSQGGRFITDDGRVFFTTPEPLEPRDTNTGFDVNGRIAGTDVYEFVDGRPQLITTGTGTVPGGPFRGGGLASPQPGLYGVSADGVDVYFGTLDTLVGQDRNGQQMKFYDARTNGGFPFVPPPAPCAAADECHGSSSSAPAPLANGTGTALGTGGNARAGNKRKHHKRKHHKRNSRDRAVHHQTGGVR